MWCDEVGNGIFFFFKSGNRKGTDEWIDECFIP